MTNKSSLAGAQLRLIPTPTNQRLLAFVYMLIGLVLATMPVRAAVTYSQVTFSSDSDSSLVLSSGALIAANTLGDAPQSTTVNGVAFGTSATGLGNFNIGGGDFSTQFTSGGALDKLFSGLVYTPTTSDGTLTFSGLTVGRNYRVQLFFCNQVNDTGVPQRVSIQGVTHDTGSYGSTAIAVRAEFVATASSETISFIHTHNRCVLNAYALHDADAAVVFSSDFTSQPSGTTLYGSAVVANGRLELTPATASQNGLMLIDSPNVALSALRAAFEVYIGGGNGADGLSFNYAGNLDSTNSNAEEGSGTGLSITFDTYLNGSETVPSIGIKYGGTFLQEVVVSDLRSSTFRPVAVEVSPTGAAKVWYNGSLLINVQLSGWNPQAAWRFGFSARTGGSTDNHWIDNLTIANLNHAPTDISLSNNSVAENDVSGTTVGSLSATDPDSSDTHTFALVTGTGDADNGSFTIVGSSLKTAGSFNYESKNSYSIRVRATDSANESVEKSLTITVTDLNEAPVIGDQSFTVNENSANGSVVGTVEASDADAGQTLTYSIAGGNTGGAFSIDSSSGEITVANSNALDFETTASFALSVQVTDNGSPSLSSSAMVTVNLTDVNEAPSFTMNLSALPTSVSAWGNTGNGQLAMPANLTDARAIAAGSFHSLAARRDGTVVAWGLNTSGQTNVPPGLSGVVQVAGGYEFSVARRSNGHVVAWGNNGQGQTNVPASVTNAIDISAGAQHVLACLSNGTVTGWGYGGDGQLSFPADLTNAVSVAAGRWHSLALRSDGTVSAWGWNSSGQANVPVGLNGVVAIAAGYAWSMALKNDGTVVAWGANGSGQTNVPVSLTNAIAITAGADTGMALRNDGTLIAWGSNFYGQTNIPAGLTNVTALTKTMDFHSMVLSGGESGDSLVVTEDAGPQTEIGFLTDLSAGPGESGQTWNFIVTSTANFSYAAAPAIGIDGTLTFTVATNASGTNTVVVVMQDNGGVANGGIDSFTNTFQLVVTPVNDPPTSTAPTARSGTEDTIVSFTGGDSLSVADVDGSSLSVTLAVTKGTVTLSTSAGLSFQAGDGTEDASMTFFGTQANINAALASLTFASNPDYNGADTLTFSTSDGVSPSVMKSVSLTLTAIADIADDSVTMDEDTAISFNAITGTSGATADTFENTPSITAVTHGSNGSVNFLANGTLTYTPAVNFNGTDTFTYTVTSGGVTETGTVTVNVNNLNDAPTGADNTVAATEDASYTFSASDFGFSDSDSPANNFSAVKITTLPAVGTLKTNGVAVGVGAFLSMSSTPAGQTWTAQAGSGSRDWVCLASSADGAKLAAGSWGDYIYTSSDSGVTWTARLTDATRGIIGLASSDDGLKLVAVTRQDRIYTSTDSGVTWTPRESARFWAAVASSADGTKLVAVDSTPGLIYTSTDSGVTWTPRQSTRSWNGIASSADGTKLVATVGGGQIYTSTDSGVNWTARESSRGWLKVASSSDGTKLVAVDGNPGFIYTSTDSGVTWTARGTSQPWSSVASSSDGTVLVATVSGGQIYTSTNSGVTWVAHDSNRLWRGVAMSSDGLKMAVGLGGAANAGNIRTSVGSGPILPVFTPTTNGNGSPYASFAFQVQDDGGTANSGIDLDPIANTITINVTPVNDAPVIADQTFAVNENSTNETVVGTVEASDVDAGTTLSYSITAGNTDGAFAINSASGQISVANSSAVDFETSPSFSLTISVSDGTANAPATITINVNDENEGPMVDNQTFTLNENSTNNTVVGTVIATTSNPGGDLSFSITAGNAGGAFAIGSSSGEITVANSTALNFEVTPSFNLIVKVIDTTAPAFNATATITVNLADVNDAPTIGNQTFSIDEGSADGTSIGTVSATDADAGQSLTYSITSGNIGGAFAINFSSGEISVNTSSAVDYEFNSSFNLVVKATDNGSPTLNSSATITINVNNIGEAPIISAQSFVLAENSTNGTVIGIVESIDPDGETLNFAITGGNAGSAFSIEPATGRLKVNNAGMLDFETTPNFALTVEVTDTGVPALSASATVSVNLTNVSGTDLVKPIITLAAPAVDARIVGINTTASGTARDGGGLRLVVYKLNDGFWHATTGTTNWTAALTLIPGYNTLVVKSIDRADNSSVPIVRNVFSAISLPLTVTIDGYGSTSIPDQTPLDIGKTYSITGIPAIGNLFSNWSGDVTGTNAKLSFVMSTGLVVNANFVTNYFGNGGYTYKGLFSETNTARQHARSGSIGLSTSRSRGFSAKLQMGSEEVILAGRLGIDGSAVFENVGSGNLTVTLQLDFTSDSPDVLRGSVAGAGWTAEILAHRKIKTTFAQQGRYSLALTSTNNAFPAGGVGYVSVTSGGGISLSGRLADGTSLTLLSRSAYLSRNGSWPVYFPTHNGNGSIHGWLTVTNWITNSISGDLSWISSGGGTFYPAGFTNNFAAAGSSFNYVYRTLLLNIPHGRSVCSGGNLNSSVTNLVVASGYNGFRTGNTNGLRLVFDSRTGYFNGSITNPLNGSLMVIKAVPLQQQNVVQGYIQGSDMIGSFRLQSQ